jgi:hypothetical protein
VRAFENGILRVLSVAFPVAALVYLMHRLWLVALAMAICWFLVGAIGQGLHHRKLQSFSELASGSTPDPHSDILSNDDAFAVTKATIKISMVMGIAALAVTWSEHWYLNLAAMVTASTLTFIASIGLMFISGSRWRTANLKNKVMY